MGNAVGGGWQGAQIKINDGVAEFLHAPANLSAPSI